MFLAGERAPALISKYIAAYTCSMCQCNQSSLLIENVSTIVPVQM